MCGGGPHYDAPISGKCQTPAKTSTEQSPGCQGDSWERLANRHLASEMPRLCANPHHSPSTLEDSAPFVTNT